MCWCVDEVVQSGVHGTRLNHLGPAVRPAALTSAEFVTVV